MTLSRQRVTAIFATFLLSLVAISTTGADFPEEIPFVPTPVDVVDKMLELAEVKKGDVLYDLGSGDGVGPDIIGLVRGRFGPRDLDIDRGRRILRKAEG